MKERLPVVAGVTAGAGTSTLAAALHARDGGLISGGDISTVDVLVCAGDQRSLQDALALAARPGPSRPVLAITHHAGTHHAGTPDHTPLRGVLDELGSRFRAAVLLPHVEQWRDGVAADEAARVLAEPDRHLPVPLRRYADALRLVVAALLNTGEPAPTAPARSTDEPPPPSVRVRPVRVTPIGVTPVRAALTRVAPVRATPNRAIRSPAMAARTPGASVPAMAGPAGPHPLDELDDDAIEDVTCGQVG